MDEWSKKSHPQVIGLQEKSIRLFAYISFWVVATQLFFGIFHPKNWGRLIDYHFDD